MHTDLRFCIYIDSRNGINADDCANVNRQVSAILDIKELITVAHNLEVSSPGLNRLIFTTEHYVRFCGEEVKLILHMQVKS